MRAQLTPFRRGGTGTPLVLIHGLVASWEVWAPVLEALETRHDVYAPTIAGHRGASVLEDGVPVSVAALADVLERGLDEAGIETAHLAGNSLGGWLSLELARRGRARSVTALSPGGGWSDAGDLERVTRMLSMAVKAGKLLAGHLDWAIARPRSRHLMFRDAMRHGERVPAGPAREMLEDLVECTVFDGFMEAARRDGPFAGDMSHLHCPIRVAWGAQDRTLPFDRYGPPLLARIPQAELVMLDGVGHVPMYDDPKLVVRTILEVSAAADEADVQSTTPRTQTVAVH